MPVTHPKVLTSPGLLAFGFASSIITLPQTGRESWKPEMSWKGSMPAVSCKSSWILPGMCVSVTEPVTLLQGMLEITIMDKAIQ